MPNSAQQSIAPRLRIGTCSWKYDSWRDLVYTEQDSQNYLKAYAAHYSTVEIDQWFWSLFPGSPPALPKPKTVREYNQSVPPGFKFSVKVPNSITLTHYYNRNSGTPLQANPHFLSIALFEEFLERLQPFGGKLGPIMLQFEYLNKQKMPSLGAFLQHLDRFFAKCPTGYEYGLEIRNPHYLNPNYFDFVQSHHLAHVFLQGYFMPSIFEIYENVGDKIGERTVIRLHGPNRSGIEKMAQGTWNRIVAPKDDELEAASRMITHLIERDIETYVNVNNHYEGSAPLSIDRLRARFNPEAR